RGEDVELDVAPAAARGRAQVVDGDEGEVARQAADHDAAAQALVALDGHARHALQRLGQVLLREVGDVRRHDGVGEADVVALDVDGLRQAAPIAAGDDDL